MCCRATGEYGFEVFFFCACSITGKSPRVLPSGKPASVQIHRPLAALQKHVQQFVRNRHLPCSSQEAWTRSAIYKRPDTLDGQNRLPEIIQGIEFRDGIKHESKAA
jgi:hypothetical protein